MTSTDPVNHPAHYKDHPSGVECIRITEHMNFCLGNAVKYIWRASLKGNTLEDLKKSRWYIDREIDRLERQELPGSDLPVVRREIWQAPKRGINVVRGYLRMVRE